jgi:hypothetical protein
MKQTAPHEADYSRALLLRAAHEFQDVRFFRRNVAAGKLERGGYIRVEVKGMCDIYCIGKSEPTGFAVHYEIELKRFTKLSTAQKRWREWCQSWGVPWTCLHVHEGELPAETIERWVVELRKFFLFGA